MAFRVRPSPRERILNVFEWLPLETALTRSDIAAQLGISYWSARYWLERLVEEKFLRKELVQVGRAIRRVLYFKLIPVVYYRTQVAFMFYTLIPRTKTPDPIAEFRVTVVSHVKDKYDLEEFKRACIYIGVILAPQTYWIKQQVEVTADEKDEPIDPDELPYSVPVHKRLNYAERYAVFFRSRRAEERKWRSEHPYWWLDPTKPKPLPEKGDYEYDERIIKDTEEKKILLGVLHVRFDNERGVMESVEV